MYTRSGRTTKASAHFLPQSETLWTHSSPLPEAEGFPDASEAHRDRGRGPSTDPWERGNRALAWIFQNKPIVVRSGFNSTLKQNLKRSPVTYEEKSLTVYAQTYRIKTRTMLDWKTCTLIAPAPVRCCKLLALLRTFSLYVIWLYIFTSINTFMIRTRLK